MHVAVIAITRNGVSLGKKLCENIEGINLYVSRRYTKQTGAESIYFEPADLKSTIAGIWKKYDGFIFIMATGIVVRMIAQLLESKQIDPAIVVIDDCGRFAISLLSGHLGGANALAERCSLVCGAQAVITTATDVNNLPSFDMLAKEQGWLIEDISQVKHLNTLLLDNQEIAVVDHGGASRCWLNGRGNISFYDSFAEALLSPAHGFLFVTNCNPLPQTHQKKLLILRPRNLVLGIGCNRGTSANEIEHFVTNQLTLLFLSTKSVCCIASAAAKSDEPGMLEYAARLGVPFHYYPSEELNLVSFPSLPSAHALAAVGCGGVAEPAAILASGSNRLLLNKVKSKNVTLAVAELEGV